MIFFSGVDVYFSPHFDTYNVSVHPRLGEHIIEYDSKYRYENGRFISRVKRETASTDGSSPNNTSTDNTKNTYLYIGYKLYG